MVAWAQELHLDNTRSMAASPLPHSPLSSNASTEGSELEARKTYMAGLALVRLSSDSVPMFCLSIIIIVEKFSLRACALTGILGPSPTYRHVPIKDRVTSMMVCTCSSPP